MTKMHYTYKETHYYTLQHDLIYKILNFFNAIVRYRLFCYIPYHALCHKSTLDAK